MSKWSPGKRGSGTCPPYVSSQRRQNDVHVRPRGRSNKTSGTLEKVGERHVSFPNCRLWRHESALQAASVKPNLTLAMPAAIALAAALLVYQGIAAALWTQIAGHAQMTQAQWWCRNLRMRIIAIAVDRGHTTRSVRRLCLLLLPFSLQRIKMHFQGTSDSVGQRANLLHTEADRAAAADTTQLIGNFLGAIGLRERAEHAQVERDYTAQCLCQCRDITSCLTNVNEYLKWPMLVTVDRDIDLPFWCSYMASVSM